MPSDVSFLPMPIRWALLLIAWPRLLAAPARADGDVYRGPWKDDVPVGSPTPMMLARRRFREESRQAVAKQVQKVCRAMQVGIRRREWISGTVVGVEGDRVAGRSERAAMAAMARALPNM